MGSRLVRAGEVRQGSRTLENTDSDEGASRRTGAHEADGRGIESSAKLAGLEHAGLISGEDLALLAGWNATSTEFLRDASAATTSSGSRPHAAPTPPIRPRDSMTCSRKRGPLCC
jgi:hypothetical protein